MASHFDPDMMDMDQDAQQYSGPSLETMPNEMLIEISILIAATDIPAVRSLIATSRHFRNLLSENENFIAKAAFDHMSPTGKVVLGHLVRRCSTQYPLEWLQDAQRISANIESGLLGLKNLGVHRDNSDLFKNNYNRNVNIKHADRVLRTILLSIELVNISGCEIFEFDEVNRPNSPCSFLTAFFYRIISLSQILAERLYGRVDNRRSASFVLQHRVGTPAINPLYETKRKSAAVIKCILMYYGGSALYHLLGDQNLALEFHGRHFAQSFGPPMGLQHRQSSQCLEQSVSEILAHLLAKISTRPVVDMLRLGLLQPAHVDLACWRQTIPDDAAWNKLMQEQGWGFHADTIKSLVCGRWSLGHRTKNQQIWRPSYISMRFPRAPWWQLQQPNPPRLQARFQSFEQFATQTPTLSMVRYLTNYRNRANDFSGMSQIDKEDALARIVIATQGGWEAVNFDHLQIPQRWLHAQRMKQFFQDHYASRVFVFTRWSPTEQVCSPAAKRMQPKPRRMAQPTISTAANANGSANVKQEPRDDA